MFGNSTHSFYNKVHSLTLFKFYYHQYPYRRNALFEKLRPSFLVKWCSLRVRGRLFVFDIVFSGTAKCDPSLRVRWHTLQVRRRGSVFNDAYFGTASHSHLFEFDGRSLRIWLRFSSVRSTTPLRVLRCISSDLTALSWGKWTKWTIFCLTRPIVCDGWWILFTYGFTMEGLLL